MVTTARSAQTPDRCRRRSRHARHAGAAGARRDRTELTRAPPVPASRAIHIRAGANTNQPEPPAPEPAQPERDNNQPEPPAQPPAQPAPEAPARQQDASPIQRAETSSRILQSSFGSYLEAHLGHQLRRRQLRLGSWSRAPSQSPTSRHATFGDGRGTCRARTAGSRNVSSGSCCGGWPGCCIASTRNRYSQGWSRFSTMPGTRSYVDTDLATDVARFGRRGFVSTGAA